MRWFLVKVGSVKAPALHSQVQPYRRRFAALAFCAILALAPNGVRAETAEDRYAWFSSRPWLTITPVGGDPVGLVLMGFPDDASRALGLRISESGKTQSFLISGGPLSWGSTKTGGGGNDLNEEELADVLKFAAAPPPGLETLPDVEHRLLVLAWGADGWTTRVYDRADLPNEVLRLLRVVPRFPLREMGAWVFRFTADEQVTVQTRAFPPWSALFDVSPDGKILAWVGGAKATLVDLAEPEPLPAAPPRPSGRDPRGGFTPDGRFFLVTGHHAKTSISIYDTDEWTKAGFIQAPDGIEEFRRIQFSPDGRTVAVETTGRALTYRIGDWRPAPVPRGIPDQAVWYELSPNGRTAVVWREDAPAALWDRERNTATVSVPGSARAVKARFSPDGASVLTVTSERSDDPNAKSHWHVRVLNSATGEVKHELLAYDCYPLNQPDAPLWTADGEYVLVPDRQVGSWTEGRIHLWNARSGRHRADFTLPNLVSGGFGFSANEAELIAGTWNGELLIWDFQSALAEVRSLEQSLSD